MRNKELKYICIIKVTYVASIQLWYFREVIVMLMKSLAPWGNACYCTVLFLYIVVSYQLGEEGFVVQRSNYQCQVCVLILQICISPWNTCGRKNKSQDPNSSANFSQWSDCCIYKCASVRAGIHLHVHLSSLLLCTSVLHIHILMSRLFIFLQVVHHYFGLKTHCYFIPVSVLACAFDHCL